jgi:hypothetical protein
VAPSIRKSWQSLRRQAAVARGLRPWSFFFQCEDFLLFSFVFPKNLERHSLPLTNEELKDLARTVDSEIAAARKHEPILQSVETHDLPDWWRLGDIDPDR